MSQPRSLVKPFEISKWAVQEAYGRVKANKGAAGVDRVSIEEFDSDLRNNLYKVWNRMSSGTYFPPPVRVVEIPKTSGGVRVLGVPTVADRVAQTVVAMELEKRVEPMFYPDSYGYRPKRSALDAVSACRERCWKSGGWVIDLDIAKFFDTVDHDLVVKAVRANTDSDWVVLYVRRWLSAPLQRQDGTLEQRDRGTPQGSAVSPVLANLFMHYAFDMWMARKFPSIGFERYVDDAVVHCASEKQALMLRGAIGKRLAEVGLKLHPEKTKVVYCHDRNRRSGSYEHTSFTFLGYEFRARRARTSTESSSTRSCPRSARTPRRGSTARFAVGDCIGIPIGPWASSRGGSIRLCGAGCSITAAFIGRSCMRCVNASTPIWCGGLVRNIDGCMGSRKSMRGGKPWENAILGCSSNGNTPVGSWRLDGKSRVTGDC